METHLVIDATSDNFTRSLSAIFKLACLTLYLPVCNYWCLTFSRFVFLSSPSSLCVFVTGHRGLLNIKSNVCLSHFGLKFWFWPTPTSNHHKPWGFPANSSASSRPRTVFFFFFGHTIPDPNPCTAQYLSLLWHCSAIKLSYQTVSLCLNLLQKIWRGSLTTL